MKPSITLLEVTEILENIMSTGSKLVSTPTVDVGNPNSSSTTSSDAATQLSALVRTHQANTAPSSSLDSLARSSSPISPGLKMAEPVFLGQVAAGEKLPQIVPPKTMQQVNQIAALALQNPTEAVNSVRDFIAANKNSPDYGTLIRTTLGKEGRAAIVGDPNIDPYERLERAKLIYAKQIKNLAVRELTINYPEAAKEIDQLLVPRNPRYKIPAAIMDKVNEIVVQATNNPTEAVKLFKDFIKTNKDLDLHTLVRTNLGTEGRTAIVGENNIKPEERLDRAKLIYSGRVEELAVKELKKPYPQAAEELAVLIP